MDVEHMERGVTLLQPSQEGNMYTTTTSNTVTERYAVDSARKLSSTKTMHPILTHRSSPYTSGRTTLPLPQTARQTTSVISETHSTSQGPSTTHMSFPTTVHGTHHGGGGHHSHHSHITNVFKNPIGTRNQGIPSRAHMVDLRERVTYVGQHTGEERVLGEYFVEHEVKVPKKVVREDVIERTIIVPERILVEEYLEEDARYVEKIVEVARPIIQEKIVEVPEYEYVEKIVEIPQKVLQEKLREVPKLSVQERIIEIPKIVQKDKIVEVPVYEYHDVIVEKNVEVPEVREEYVIKEVPVPQYVEKLVPEERTIEINENVSRNIPVPMEALTQLELVLPRVRAIRTAMDVPVYVPRFVEVPVAAEFCNEEFVDIAERCGQEVSRLMMRASTEPIPLTALENVAEFVQTQQLEETFARQDFVANFVHWWRSNQLSIDEVSLRSVCRTVEEASGVVVTEAVSLVKPSIQKIVPPARSSQATDMTTVVSRSEVVSTAGSQQTQLVTSGGTTISHHPPVTVVKSNATTLSHHVPVSLMSDGGLEQAVMSQEADTQSIKTDKAEEGQNEELNTMMPVLATRHSVDSLSSLPLPRNMTYSQPTSRSNSSSIPKHLTTSSPAPIFPIMKGMETSDVSVPMGDVQSRLTGTTFGTLEEEEVVASQEEIDDALEDE